MILRRAILLVCGIAALAASAAMAVVALGFALYAALLPLWGPALAAGGVAGACVLLGLVGGVAAIVAAQPRPVTTKVPAEGLAARALGLAKENPILAAVAMGIVGVIAVRNPKITAALVGTFLAGKPPTPRQ